MARLDALPSIDIINALAGVIDIYIWRGIPCARRWPRYRPASRSAPAIASANLFGTIVKAYSLLADTIIEALRDAAADNPRTSRDIFVSAVLGHLHEASMSDFLTLLTEARDFLEDLTALLGALDSIDTDELVVNVDESVLPTGASTAAHQVTQEAALTTIAKLETALQTVATDRLKTRGEDQLFSVLTTLEDVDTDTQSGAGNLWLVSAEVPAATLWIVTNIHTANDATVATRAFIIRQTGGVNHIILHKTAPPINDGISWQGRLVLKPGDTIQSRWIGNADADVLTQYVLGHVMTLET